MTKDHKTVYEIFQTTREQKGLSLSDAANALHLTITVIEQIEAGEFSQSHLAPVFMRGYMRSYAKYLGLSQDDVNEIVKTLDAEAPIIQTIVEKSPPIQKEQQPHRSPKKILFYLIVVIILIVLASFWHDKNKTTDEQQPKIVTPTENATATPMEITPALLGNEEIAASQPEESTLIPAEEDTPTQLQEDLAALPEPAEPATLTPPPVENTPPTVSAPTPEKKITPPTPTAPTGPEVVDAQETP